MPATTILRPWSVNDLDDLVRFANNPRIAAFLMNAFPHPYTREDGLAFLDRVLSARPFRILAIDLDGTAIGSIGVFPQEDIFCRNAEMGYWLGEPYWGRGIMTQVIPQMIDYAFRSFDIDRIFARPFGTNRASQRVLEKCGFQLEAQLRGTIVKNGIVEDELIYGYRKR